MNIKLPGLYLLVLDVQLKIVELPQHLVQSVHLLDGLNFKFCLISSRQISGPLTFITRVGSGSEILHGSDTILRGLIRVRMF